jgi:hypothetical protein
MTILPSRHGAGSEQICSTRHPGQVSRPQRTSLDWLGRQDLIDLELSPAVASLLHLSGGPIHTDDLLWQVCGARVGDHLTAADHEAARRALRRWSRPVGPPGLGGQLSGAAPAVQRRAQS